MAVSRVYIHLQTVRFGECDPAGIVYFPRFFDYFHVAMESWFGVALDRPYQQLVLVRKLGFPAVHTEADFMLPSRFGETLAISLRVPRVGTSSIAFDYEVRDAAAPDGPVRVTGSTTCVVMDLDPASATLHRALSMPQDLRECIERFGVG